MILTALAQEQGLSNWAGVKVSVSNFIHSLAIGCVLRKDLAYDGVSC